MIKIERRAADQFQNIGCRSLLPPCLGQLALQSCGFCTRIRARKRAFAFHWRFASGRRATSRLRIPRHFGAPQPVTAEITRKNALEATQSAGGRTGDRGRKTLGISAIGTTRKSQPARRMSASGGKSEV